MTPLHLRDRLRRLPAGEALVHALVFLLGLAFIGLGLALSVLPGPFTVPPVLVGLLVWSLEFDFAERWLDKVKGQAQDAWDGAKARPLRAAALTAVSLALLVGALVAGSHYGVVDRVQDAVT